MFVGHQVFVELVGVGAAFFEEGGEDFLGGGGGDEVAEEDHLLVDGLDRAAIRRALQERLGHGERAGRAGGELLCGVHGGGHQFAGGQHAIDEAGFPCGRGIEGLAQHQQFGGALVAGDARQQKAGAALGAEREIDEGQLEAGIVGGIDQVAMQQHGRADTHRVAGDGGDDGLFEGRRSGAGRGWRRWGRRPCVAGSRRDRCRR
jgi:hypothetical protein